MASRTLAASGSWASLSCRARAISKQARGARSAATATSTQAELQADLDHFGRVLDGNVHHARVALARDAPRDLHGASEVRV
jgi:hypothetical protein